MKRYLAFIFGIISSILLIISGTTGITTWIKIQEFILNYVNSNIINLSFVIIFIIASLGGVSVFIGSLLVLKKKYFIGRWLITLGTGVGLISFFLKLFLSIIKLEFSVNSYLSISSLGILFALISQILSRKK